MQKPGSRDFKPEVETLKTYGALNTWEIHGHKGETLVRMVKVNGQQLLDLRIAHTKGKDRQFLTPKGLRMNQEEFKKFLELGDEILQDFVDQIGEEQKDLDNS